MNRMKCFTKWAMAIVAVGLVLGWAPASRAEDKASETAATQPASPAPAAAQPAAAQPTADQRLEELEKEVTLLQQQIASLKSDSEPGLKTAAYAQPAGSSSPTPAGEKVSLAGLLGNVTLSGFGDVYYSYDNNHPFNNLAGLRSFEAPTNGFNFNMAEFIIDKAPDAMSSDGRLGYHLSAGYGSAARIVNGSDATFGDGSNFYLKEAYLSYLAPVGKGLTVNVGKFVTPFGAEVIESASNWNYSRGLLFNYAIPFFHFGASAKYAFNSKVALTGYLVNGWNNTIINHNSAFGQSSGLTYGASLAVTPNMKWSVIENYFAGPVLDAFTNAGATANDWKQLSDTVVSYTPNSKWAFMLNGDYGFGPRVFDPIKCDAVVSVSRPRPQGIPASCLSPAVNWWGVAGYAKYTLSPKTNFAVRYEYFDDPQGYTGLLVDQFDGDLLGRGWAQGVTGTYSYNLTSALLIRGEYRYDFASQPMFSQSFSSNANDGCGCVKEQNTATISFVYSFSSANAK